MSVAGPLASAGEGNLLEALELVGRAERVADRHAEQRTESSVVGGAWYDRRKAGIWIGFRDEGALMVSI